MKIVLFDARKEERKFFGDGYTYIDEPLSAETVEQAKDADVISVFVSSEVTKEMIDSMPVLKLVATRSTGYDHIDVAYATEKNITVSTVPAYGDNTVAEFTFALLLGISRKLYDAYHQVRESGDMSFTHLKGFDLYGKTIGVIGTGKIGKNVVRIASGFGMKVLCYDAFPDTAFAQSLGITYVQKEELFRLSDVITLHVPLLPQTRHIINRDALRKMKKGVVIINTARGELIDTTSLISAIQDGKVSGAGLDVLEGERELREEQELVAGEKKIKDVQQLLEDHVLINMPQVVVTPHVAFYTEEADREILSVTKKNIEAYDNGAPQNTVSV
jgi:D-lactate dehydrogenase